MGIPVAVAPTSTLSVSVCTTRRGITVNDVLRSTTTSRGATASQATASLASCVTVMAMPQAATTTPPLTLSQIATTLVEVGCVTTARMIQVGRQAGSCGGDH